MDRIKGLAMVYIVLDHAQSPVDPFIRLFHLSLFFIVSGYFYNEEYSKKPFMLFKKRIKSLYIPFIKYELLFLLLHNVFFKFNIYNINVPIEGDAVTPYTGASIIKAVTTIFLFWNREPLLGVFWFFTVLFAVNILFCMIRYTSLLLLKTINEYIIAMVILLLFVLGNILSYFSITLPLGFHVSLVVLLTFYAGFLYRRYAQNMPFNMYIAGACFCILFISMFSGSVNVPRNTYSSPLFFIGSTVLGFYLTMYMVNSAPAYAGKFLEMIGRNTIIIMAFHLLSFKIINAVQVYAYRQPERLIASFPVLDSSGGWWIAYVIIGIGVPLLIKYGMLKIIQFKNSIYVKYRYGTLTNG